MSIFDSIASTLPSSVGSSFSLDRAAQSVQRLLTTRVLKSDWTGLNPNLLAKFYPLKRTSDGWTQSNDVRQLSAADNFTVDDGYEVWCPITDGQSEMSLNWHSPFEGAGAESKAPTVSSMLQSGSLSPAVQAIGEQTGATSATDSASAALASAEGRVGITKLNSTQVFQGMPPVKLSMMLHFRALIDPVTEVKAPISMLKQWAVPQYLAADGVLANAIKNGSKDGIVQTIFPSMAPQIIGMRYGDMTYEPLVIESVSDPITGPRDVDGVMISCSVNVTLATLTAIDRRDIQRIYA
ncbi:hypothetical protein LA345_38950 (plasmid) [Burkholderia vietnamiensis]|uniref:Uncharacterized protein n=1 Tax=Burkholderia vietnamiensis (strain G4 / LMG 22486) TaxID=269482 RepID=A4JWF0_BURVG|nr:conserved hypothetical protein [Burkholderia vietnamiensis G4]MCB4349778.1 hypothetical protein [Burkholderia vietnamiensis]